MVRLLLALLLALLAPAAFAAEQPDGIRIWVEIDHDGPIHPQEMVILRVHGRFTIPITLEKMADPDFAGFRQVRVDRDRWSEVFEDGITKKAFERVIAVFPQHSGRLTVGPFVHHLTVLDSALKQVKVDVSTDPVSMTVAPAEGPGDAWWLPASGFTVEETWSHAPESLAIGQSVRRTVTFSAKGVFDDQLPPAPTMTADGLIVFPGNAERWTKIGLGRDSEGALPLREQALRRKGRLEEVATPFLGPFASVTYSWDVRPATDAPVTLPAIAIPWFDTEAGVMRTANLPARTVALAPVGPDTERLERALGIIGGNEPQAAGRAGSILVAAAAVAGFLAATAGGLLGLAPDVAGRAAARLSAVWARRAALRRARSAARSGNIEATRSAVAELRDAERFSRAAAGADEALARLDAHLFGGAAPPDLPSLVRAIRWAPPVRTAP